MKFFKKQYPLGWKLRNILKVLLSSLVVTVAAVIGYHNTPIYKLSELVYWEALEQSPEEHEAIRWIVANRKDMNRPEWGDTFFEVITAGARRGVNREFTYLHHQGTQRGIREGGPVLPYAHAVRNGYVGRLMRINLETAWFLTRYYSGLGSDPTNGASFYVVASREDGWFARSIRNDTLRNPTSIGAHRTYELWENGVKVPIYRRQDRIRVQPLRPVVTSAVGSSEAVAQAFEYAHARNYFFVDYGWHVPFASLGKLDRLNESETVELHDVSYPFLQHEVVKYVERLAIQYAANCGGEQLTVTSALRPVSEQPPNASARSVHPTGMAFDLSVANNSCQSWLRAALLLGEERRYVQVTREHSPAHWHVVVYPDHYIAWRRNQ